MATVACRTCGNLVEPSERMCPKCGKVPAMKNMTPEQYTTFKWALSTWAILTGLYLLAVLV
jgi:RNA polymerase subunit RPABC4/transcription elongation factor Spt4